MSEIPEKYKEEPRVTLGGREWAVPPLSARRIIRFGSLAASITDINARLPEPDMLRIYEAIYTGISQGIDEPLTFDQFLDNYHIDFEEVLGALATVSRQAGMEMKTKATASGEAKAELSVDEISSKAGMTQ